ncbi:hypothetical protein C0585_00600 [Candidatus Woesearchaeota archaeon]|uniref:hypothetical protein n=1 Tax=uncultured Arcobacter sp. TaxID=165434 RepID=UPI000CAC27C5|nr:hypothetical protein [uncultured Arcobacter sp.]PLW80823.1 MAG: hypothetical protein C0585_00600 [Candidatus Woesearchaeota archaeon]
MKENVGYYTVPIHFGNFQGEHKINSSSLSIFIEAYKEISKTFGIEIEVQIGIPSEGGWKSNLLVGIGLIGINPFVALLTGETADDWAKKGHTEIVKYINQYITTEANDLSDEIPKECTKQKNKIYQQFQKDNCIDSFKIDTFPAIPKLNFQNYIKEIPDEEVVYLGETNITVHSPDWKGKRSWKGKIEILKDKENAFDFDKDLTGRFWEKVKLDLLPLHTTDVMRVQLIKRPTRQVKYLAIRVLNYNGEEIDTPIINSDISKIALIDYPAEDELNLFSFEYGQLKDE